MIRYYAGVGSRETPPFVLRAMTKIAAQLEAEGFILRSGGAIGADTAFEVGVVDEANKEIYLSEKGYEGHPSPLFGYCERALALVKTIHPKFSALGSGGIALHSRNCYQVLGRDLETPSDFVVSWTENAAKKGGTRTAIVLAERNRIPVLNLGKCKSEDEALWAFDRFYLLAA